MNEYSLAAIFRPMCCGPKERIAHDIYDTKQNLQRLQDFSLVYLFFDVLFFLNFFFWDWPEPSSAAHVQLRYIFSFTRIILEKGSSEKRRVLYTTSWRERAREGRRDGEIKLRAQVDRVLDNDGESRADIIPFVCFFVFFFLF